MELHDLSDAQIAAMTAEQRRDLIWRLARPVSEVLRPGVDVRRLRRQRVLLMSVAAAALVPWTVYLGVSLPDRYVARHWTLTWVGFDAVLLTMFAATALLGLFRRQLVALTAFASGVLLLCDAWFDVTYGKCARPAVLDRNGRDRGGSDRRLAACPARSGLCESRRGGCSRSEAPNRCGTRRCYSSTTIRAGSSGSGRPRQLRGIEAPQLLACRCSCRPSWPLGRDVERTMPTLWIHGGVIPPCPFCGAPPEDQNRRPTGADRAVWHCLICQRARPPDPGWDDPLVPISLEDWRVLCRVMAARLRAR